MLWVQSGNTAQHSTAPGPPGAAALWEEGSCSSAGAAGEWTELAGASPGMPPSRRGVAPLGGAPGCSWWRQHQGRGSRRNLRDSLTEALRLPQAAGLLCAAWLQMAALRHTLRVARHAGHTAGRGRSCMAGSAWTAAPGVMLAVVCGVRRALEVDWVLELLAGQSTDVRPLLLQR